MKCPFVLSNDPMSAIQGEIGRAALHLEAMQIRCVRGLNPHLQLVKRLKSVLTPLHLEAEPIWWYDFF
jgi:hypothetical protein